MNFMQIFSFSNLSDLSWGNRPAGVSAVSKAEKDKEKMNKIYKNDRSIGVIIWVICNIFYVFLVEQFVLNTA